MGWRFNKTTPPNFPAGIAVERENYRNWSKTIAANRIWTCTPATAEDIIAICNWAKSQPTPWRVRPKGVAHGWSPLTIANDTPSEAPVLLVDLITNLNKFKFLPAKDGTPPMVQAEAGAKMYNLLQFLQYQPGGNGAAMGFAFPHVPAPGNLTVGGVLAINGHGTAVPSPNEDIPASYGSLSNQIVSFTAVVSSDTAPHDYELREFNRGNPETAALLVHAGRALIVSATLQVIDNYNMRCQSMMNISAGTLFAAPSGDVPSAQSLGAYLDTSGRVEAIWYPFTDDPWLKVWTVEPTQPAGAISVHDAYNYAFSDNLPDWVTTQLKSITTSNPELTPTFEKAFAFFTKTSLSFGGISDIWGASMNTLLYVRDTTLRVTANGYAIQMRRADVQQAVHDFTQKFQSMIAAYADNGQYPVNCPLEIRVTGLDTVSDIHVASPKQASTPLMSSLTYDAYAEANGYDCAVWFDVLTLPGTPHANAFYTELEDWLVAHFTAPSARLLPEWSKGWAYTSEGGWTNQTFLANIRNTLSEGRTDQTNWAAISATYEKLDKAHLFSSPLLDALFDDA